MSAVVAGDEHGHDHGSEVEFLEHDACVTDQHRPTFDHEWQRRAFGVAVALSEFGHYPWAAFQQELIGAIGEWEREADVGTDDWEYYDHWVAALERILVGQQLVTDDELQEVR